MVKADRQVRLQARYESFGRFIPERPLFAITETDNQCLVWKRDRSGPTDSEGSEVRDRSDRRALGFFRQALLFCGLEELFVLPRQSGQRLFIEVREDRHDNSVFHFDGDADVDRSWKNNL